MISQKIKRKKDIVAHFSNDFKFPMSAPTPLPQTSHTTALATSTPPMVNCIRKKADRNGKALTPGGLPVPAYLRRFPPILSPSAKKEEQNGAYKPPPNSTYPAPGGPGPS